MEEEETEEIADRLAVQCLPLLQRLDHKRRRRAVPHLRLVACDAVVAPGEVLWRPPGEDHPLVTSLSKRRRPRTVTRKMRMTTAAARSALLTDFPPHMRSYCMCWPQREDCVHFFEVMPLIPMLRRSP